MVKKLASRDDLGHLHVLKIKLWDHQKELLEKIPAMVTGKLFFDHFHSVGGQLNTFIIYAPKQEDLASFLAMPVKENLYDIDEGDRKA